ncbi:response regulator [Methylobacterium sp. R2-1]|uniref:response regulator n=1 Tax=Methylobacterium sp. R2-1 TaxID=2587064 RepID=UPI001617607D|nr:response regulator [Methylobacterium sp. R2-1]MBB2961876.1 CheY-like chemotaxis protein [Methylobacterium sp. R2-1]
MATPEGNTTAGIITAVASLVSALAWPVLVGIIFYAMYSGFDTITEKFEKFMRGKESAKIGVSPSGGFTLEVVQHIASASANAVIESAKKSSTGALSETQVSEVSASATSAAISLTPNVFDPQKRLSVLWVDDHPENNIDLQFAFQALGIIVICIDSNNGIEQAFEDASNFDVVITDMYRDGLANGSRQTDAEAGMKTVEKIRLSHPSVKIIIYAGSWSASHRSDYLQPPVTLITNYPQEVYNTVVDMAKIKAR